MKNQCLLICALFLVSTSVMAQLEWVIKPIIEQDKFIYKPDHAKELIIVTGKDGRQGVLKRNGEYLFSPGTFSRVNFINGNGVSYGLTEQNETIVFNSQGKILSDGYDRLNGYHHTNILLTEKNKLFGLIDTLGNIVREPKYKNIKRIKRGLYEGNTPNGPKEKIMVEESDGRTPKGRASFLRIISSKIKDRIIVTAKSKKRGYSYHGFTNIQGDTILRPDRYFSDSRKMDFEAQVMIAIDSQTDKHGVLDKDGKIVVPFEYDDIWSGVIHDEFVIAHKGSQYSIIDLKGQVRGTIKADKMYPLRDHLYVKAEIDKKVYLLLPDLTPAVEEGFDAVRDPFKKDFTILSKNKLRGFYSFRTGKYTPPQFRKFKMPALDKFAVSKGNQFGLFDVHKGEFVTDTIYSNIQKQGHYYLATTERQDSVLKDSIYKKITVRSYTVYDSTIQVVFGPVNHPIKRVAKDLFKESVTRDSLIVHNFQTGQKRIFTNRSLLFMKDNVVRLDMGVFTFADEIFNAEYKTYELLTGRTEQLRRFKENGKFGLLHQRKVVLEPKYDLISQIKEGLITVKLNGKQGILKNSYN